MDDNITEELIEKIIVNTVINDSHVIYPENLTVYETRLHPIRKENKMLVCPLCGCTTFAIYDDCDQAICLRCKAVLFEISLHHGGNIKKVIGAKETKND